MFNIIEYKELVDEDNIIYIDVRSEKEYKEDTIPGAINIPVLTDEERVVVGTLYVQSSVEEARSKGIELISKRLPEIFNKMQELYINNKEKKIVIFCARGGMRSGSIHSLLLSLGIKVYKLKGGYKTYRKYINEELQNIIKEVKLIVLHGKTGTGKTLILKSLEEQGYNILDLEMAANHRGSFLGGVALGKQNSQKKFESYIYEKLKNRKGDLVFIEGESKRIGNIIIPNCLWSKMQDGIQILIKGNMNLRAEILVGEYTKDKSEVEELLIAMEELKRYINVSRVEEYKRGIKEGDFKGVAIELMEKYYDPLYNNSLKDKSYYEIIELNNTYEGVNRLKEIFEIL